MNLCALWRRLFNRRRVEPRDYWAPPGRPFDVGLRHAIDRSAILAAGPQTGWDRKDYAVFRRWKIENALADSRRTLSLRQHVVAMRREYESGAVFEDEKRIRDGLAAQIHIAEETKT